MSECNASVMGGDANLALVATASAFLAVGFSRPNAQAYDELKSEFIVATKARLSLP